MLVDTLALPGFSGLLDLDCVKFPPAKPKPMDKWVSKAPLSYQPAPPVKVSGWLVHVPGFCGPRFFRKQERANAYHAYLTQLMKAASYLAVIDGHLYDYRGGRPPRLLRRDYRALFPVIHNGRELMATLRAIPAAQKPASHFFRTATEGSLCPACVVEELGLIVNAIRGDIDYEWQVVGWDIHWEDQQGPLTCDNCCRIISPIFDEGDL